MTEGRSIVSSRTISDVIKTQALGIFISGVISPIRTILKAKSVRTLEEAVNVALEEEKAFENDQASRNFNKKTPRYYNNNHNNNDNWRSHAYNPQYNNNGTSRNNNSYRSTENNTNIKREFNNVRLICAYCKKPNHHISECRKLKYNKNKKQSNTSRNEQHNNYNNRPGPSNSNKNTTVKTVQEMQASIKIITKINNDHIMCKTPNTVSGEAELFIDSGDEINLIKLNSLAPNMLVDTTQTKYLAGIHSTPVVTLGATVFILELGEQKFEIPMDIVNNDFPIPRDGLLGKQFLKGQGAVLDLNEDILIIPHSEKNIIIPARSEYIMSVNAKPELEGQCLMISNMQLAENVFLSNCISQVQEGQVVASVINNSEENIEISKVDLNDIEWEEYLNSTFYTINVSEVNLNGQTEILNRIQMLDNELELKHLNNEERENVE